VYAVVRGVRAAALAQMRISKSSPVGRYGTEQSFAAPRGQWPADSWWQAYGDPQLNGLIDEALADSPSNCRRQGSPAARTGERPGRRLGEPAAGERERIGHRAKAELPLSHARARVTPQGWNDYSRANARFFLGARLLGQEPRGARRGHLGADAVRADAAQARLTLSTAIASAYAELARVHAALDTAKRRFEVRVKTADLLRQRYAQRPRDAGQRAPGGIASRSPRRPTFSRSKSSSRCRETHRGSDGRGPDRGLAIARPAVALTKSFALPQRIPAELLGRRPDIAAARMRAEAAAQADRPGAAAFYPNVNLLAFIGCAIAGLRH
jgi:outer membrane protein TolC